MEKKLIYKRFSSISKKFDMVDKKIQKQILEELSKFNKDIMKGIK